MSNLPTITWADISSLFAHPLFLLLVGAGITGILAPRITTKWQDDKKKREIKVSLVARSGMLIGIAMGHASYNLLKNESNKAPVFDSFLQDWFTKTYTFYVETLAFYGQELASQWQDFFRLLENYVIVSKHFMNGEQTPIYLSNLVSDLHDAKIEDANINWQTISGSDLSTARSELKKLAPHIYALGKRLQEKMLENDIFITSKS